jgi:(p)ppGpp synthase/HD superfamily hydrolase
MPDSLLFSPLVEQALRTAAFFHRHDVRKGSDTPYFAHPAAVAIILLRAGLTDDNMLAAALLHDVVEDTPCTLDELAAEFPPEVVQYVAALSEQKTDEHGNKRPWKLRKEDHLKEVAEAPLPVRAIVLADKLHNLATMCYDIGSDDNFWDRFNATQQDILWYNRTMVDQAAGNDESLQRIATECRAHIAQLEAATTNKG